MAKLLQPVTVFGTTFPEETEVQRLKDKQDLMTGRVGVRITTTYTKGPAIGTPRNIDVLVHPQDLQGE